MTTVNGAPLWTGRFALPCSQHRNSAGLPASPPRRLRKGPKRTNDSLYCTRQTNFDRAFELQGGDSDDSLGALPSHFSF